MKSNFLSLNLTDFLKGAALAVLAVIVATVTTLLNAGTLFSAASLTIIGTAALSAFIAYLGKQLLTNSQNQLFVTEKNATKEIVAPVQKSIK